MSLEESFLSLVQPSGSLTHIVVWVRAARSLPPHCCCDGYTPYLLAR